MESLELEITIDADGRTHVHIKGVKGPDCMTVAKVLEEIVGRADDQRLTAEFYEPPPEVRIDLRAKQ